MRLIITRSYEEQPPGDQYGWNYQFRALLELTAEEKELVAKYKLGEHILTESKYSTTTVEDLIRGDFNVTRSIDVAIGNEQALRNACAALPEIFNYCRSYGNEIVVEYSSAPIPASNAVLSPVHGLAVPLGGGQAPGDAGQLAEQPPNLAERDRVHHERFSSGDLAGLEDVDGFGELAGAPGAAAEFAQDVPGLELGVGAFAGGAQPGVGGVGGLLGGGLVPAPVGSEDVLTSADVTLVRQHD
jgi:hypothetical protein